MKSIKATSKNEQSKSIIVSFKQSEIPASLSDDEFAVFRRRGPAHHEPNLMFTYSAAPVSAITGCARIKRINRYDRCEFQNVFEKMEHIDDFTASYIKSSKRIFVYHISDYIEFGNSISLKILKEHFNFYPPQSFMILSKDGQNALVELAIKLNPRSSELIRPLARTPL